MRKKHLFFAGILAIALAVIVVVAASSTSSGSDGSLGDRPTTGPKSITITEITGKTGQVIIELSADDVKLAALGGNIISDNSVTVALYDREERPFTGSGSYFVSIFFYDNSNSYYRYGGETSDIYTPNNANLIKYAIISDESTIPFFQFYDAAKPPNGNVLSFLSANGQSTEGTQGRMRPLVTQRSQR